MYKVIREKGFKDLEDVTQHVYTKGDEFPFDNREIKESRFQELATDLNKLNEVIIESDSDLKQLNKKDIQELLVKENIEFENTDSKDYLIFNYEYQKARTRLMVEAEELQIEVTDEMSNYEIVELILKSRNN